MAGVLDENVVILKFDNSDFEKNTKQSMETLEQMKRSFKESGSGEELDRLGKAARNVDLSGIAKNVETLARKFSIFGQIGTAAINNLTSYAMRSTSRVLTALPRQIIEGGWKRALNIEQAKFQIEGLGEVWDETSAKWKKGAKTMKESVLESVRGTAYGLDEAAKVAAQFSASGLKAGSDMTAALKSIAGVASMTGSSFEDIGRIFTTVAGNGRLMGDQLLQLSTRGLNAASTIAKAMGKTESEIREMVSKGQISFEDFYKSMSEYADHATEANNTYTGSLANMKAALSRIGADVEATKLENMRHIFNALTPVIDQIHTLLGGVIDRINKMSTAVSDFAVKGLNSIEYALKPYVDTITKTNSQLSFMDKIYDHAYQKLTYKQRKATDDMTATAKEAKVAWDIINGGFSEDKKTRRAEIEKLGLEYQRVQRYTNALVKCGLDAEHCHIQVEEAAKKAGKATSKYGLDTKQAALNLSRMAPMVKIIGGLANVVNAAKSGLNGLKKVAVVVGKSLKTMFKPLVNVASSKFFEFTVKLAKSAKNFESFGKALTKSKVDSYFKKLAPETQKSVSEFQSRLKDFTSNSKQYIKSLTDFFDNLHKKLSESGKVKIFVSSIKDLKVAITEFANSKLSGASAELKKMFGTLKSTVTLDNAVASIEKFVGKLTTFIKGLTDSEKHIKGFTAMFTGLEGKLSGLGAIEFSFGKNSTNFKSLKNSVFGAVINAADMIEKAKVPERMGKAANGLQVLTNVAIASTKKFDAKSAAKTVFGLFKSFDYNKMADFGLKVSGIVGIFKVVKDLGDLTNATVGMLGSVSGFFRSLSGVAGQFKKTLKVEVFRTIAMSVAMLAGSIAILALIPKDRLKPATVAIGVIMGLLTGVVALAQSKYFDANKMRAVGVAFAGMGGAMLSLAVTCEKLAKLSNGELLKAGIVITGFIGMFVYAGNSAKLIQSSGKSFLAMAAAVDALIFAMNALAMMQWDTIIKGGSAIMYIMTELALAARIAGQARPGGFLSMAIALDLLVPAIVVMAMMPLTKALKGAAVIAGVMYAIAGAAYIVGQSKSNFKSMVAMATVVGTTAAALTVLTLLDPVKLMASALALVSTLTTIAIGVDIANQGKKGALAIIGVVAVLTGAIVVLAKLDTSKAIIAAAGLGILAVTLGLSLKAFSKLNPGAALKGLGVFSIVVAGMIALMATLGGLNKLTKGIAVKGIKEFGKILEAIGEAFGKLTGGFISGMSSGLPNAAANLSDFMKQIQPFLDLAQNIKGGSLKGVKNLSDVLFNLSQIDFSQIKDQGKLDGFSEALQEMGFQFVIFSSILGAIPKENIKKTNTMSEIMKTFTEIANSIPQEEGLKQKVTGVRSIADFASEISSACMTLSLTLSAMTGMEISKDDLNKISNIGDIISTLSKAAAKIPPSEGLVQGLEGNTTINEFAEYLAAFAPNFSAFQANLILMPDIDESQLDKIDAICAVIATMVEAGSKIPPSGGLVQFVSGNTTLKEFAIEMAEFIPFFGIFIKAVSTIGEDTMAACEKIPLIAKGVSWMAWCADKLPEVGGIKSALVGIKSLGLFAADMAAFMPGFSDFMTGLSGVTIGKSDVAKIKNIGSALPPIAELANDLSRSGGLIGKVFGNKDLGKFAEGLGDFATGVKTCSDKFKDVNTENISTKMQDIKNAVAKASEFDSAPNASKLVTLGSNAAKFAKKISGASTDGIEGKSSSIAKAVSNLAKTANTAVSGSNFKNFTSAGKAAAKNFIDGMNAEKRSVYKKGKSLGDEAKDGMKEGGKKSKDVGKNIGQGLVDGVLAKKQAAYNAGYKVGQASVQGQKDGSNTNSPSKAAIKVGKGIGQGLIIGIKSYKKKAYDSGYEIASASIQGQMDGVQMMIDDVSSPVITPVIDASGLDRDLARLSNTYSARAAGSIHVDPNSEATKIASVLDKMIGSNNVSSQNNYFSITVDGAANPDDFANQLLNSFRMKMRTM